MKVSIYLKAGVLIIGASILAILMVAAFQFGLQKSAENHISQKAQALAVLKSFWVRAMALPGINTGPANSTKRLVIIFDANCPMCAHQWEALQPYLSELRIHWVPIAFIAPSSARLGGSLLAASNPAAALAYNEEHYDFQTETGGYLPPTHFPARYVAEVRNNTDSAVIKKNVSGTPSIAFELVPGKEYLFRAGMLTAKQLPKVIPLLGGSTVFQH